MVTISIVSRVTVSTSQNESLCTCKFGFTGLWCKKPNMFAVKITKEDDYLGST